MQKDLRNKFELAIHGDKAAFEEICAAKHRDLYFTAFAMLGSKEDAEDAVQDTMISMFRNIGKLKNPKAFNAWSHQILHNSCVNIVRKKEQQLHTTPLSDGIINTVAGRDIDGEPDKILGDKEMCAELYEAIRALPEKSREALVLYYFSDMKYKDIAKVTGSSIKTVSTNLIRAKKNLESYLKENYPEMASRALASIVGGGAVFGAKLKGGALIGKHLFTVSSNLATHVAAVTVGAVCAGAVTYSVLAAPNYDIALTSDDCDCGHINPQSIELKGTRSGDEADVWALLAKDGETLHTGNLPSVTDYVQKLESDSKHGYYTLRCVITSKDGDRYAASRDIIIGNLDGDE
jgi:RNA polymerase sigma-70 factor (ECF subfamily)